MGQKYEETDQKYWEISRKYFIKIKRKWNKIFLNRSQIYEETPQNLTFEGFWKIGRNLGKASKNE